MSLPEQNPVEPFMFLGRECDVQQYTDMARHVTLQYYAHLCNVKQYLSLHIPLDERCVTCYEPLARQIFANFTCLTYHGPRMLSKTEKIALLYLLTEYELNKIVTDDQLCYLLHLKAGAPLLFSITGLGPHYLKKKIRRVKFRHWHHWHGFIKRTESALIAASDEAQYEAVRQGTYERLEARLRELE